MFPPWSKNKHFRWKGAIFCRFYEKLSEKCKVSLSFACLWKKTLTQLVPRSFYLVKNYIHSSCASAQSNLRNNRFAAMLHISSNFCIMLDYSMPDTFPIFWLQNVTNLCQIFTDLATDSDEHLCHISSIPFIRNETTVTTPLGPRPFDINGEETICKDFVFRSVLLFFLTDF